MTFRNDVSYSNYCRAGVLRWTVLALVLSPSCHVMLLHRIGSCLYRTPFGFLSRLLWWAGIVLYGADIHPGAIFEKGCYMPHTVGVVVGNGARFLGNVKLMQGSTVGGNLSRTIAWGPDRIVIRLPVFESDACVGAHALVVGPLVFPKVVFIGHNQLITSGSGRECLLMGDCELALPGELRESFSPALQPVEKVT